MAHPLVLIVFVAASEASAPQTAAMMRVATDSYGDGARLQVLAAPAPSAAAVMGGWPWPRPAAVAEVSWLDDAHQRVSLHVHLEGASRWIDRQLAFDAVDSPHER